MHHKKATLCNNLEVSPYFQRNFKMLIIRLRALAARSTEWENTRVYNTQELLVLNISSLLPS